MYKFKITGTQNCIEEIIKLIDPTVQLPFECKCPENIGYSPREAHTHQCICRDRRYIETQPDYRMWHELYSWADWSKYERYEANCEMKDNDLKITLMNEY